MWATFPPTQITHLSPSFSILLFFLIFRVQHPRSYIPVCQERSVEEVVVAGGRVGMLAHTKTFALCIRMLDSTKGPKDFSHSPHLARNTQRELPPFLTPWGFSERAICLLCVVTATISCISPLSCKWSGDPAGKIRELTGCLVLAYCLGHRNKPGVQFTTYSLLLYSSFSGVHLFRMDYNPLLLLLLNPYQICQWNI